MTGVISDGSAFAIPYGEFEHLLASLVGGSNRVVRARFRKLRLRPFPDDIRSGTGVRVQYDLPRILAIAAVFELNNLYVPQGHAVAIVQASWPEWCRAAIIAAAGANLLPKPTDMPDDVGPIVEIGCGAIAAPIEVAITPTVARHIGREDLAVRPAIASDVTRIVIALKSWAEQRGSSVVVALTVAFKALEEDFGWRRRKVRSANFDSVVPGRSFLDEGPYFDRAISLLTAPSGSFDEMLNPAARLRLQNISHYLERPAPLDAYKKEIGVSASSERLGHLLHFYARDRGLQTLGEYPLTMSPAKARSSAIALVESALRATNSLRP